MMRVSSRGLSEFQSKLSNAIRGVESDLGGMLRDEAEELAADIKSRAPIRTGRLAESVGVIEIGPNSFVIEVAAPYALHVEYGTSEMGEQPFIRPSLDAAQPGIHERFVAWVASFFS